MRAGLALALLAALPLPAAAEDSTKGVVHRVREPGETYEDLAEYYYGKRFLAHHIRQFNGRADPLDRGLTLLIPTYAALPVKKGQSLQAFAEQHLSDPGRADYLAELHNLKGKDRAFPKAGTRLRVVPSLKHLVRPGETLRSIAKVYYRDTSPDRVRLLGLYNKLDAPSLRPGAALRIPLDEPEFSRESVYLRMRVPFARVAEAAPDETPEGDSPAPKKAEAASKKRAPLRPREERPAEPAPLELAKELERLEHALADGDYARAEAESSAVFERSGGGAPASRAELLRVRAFALVALGRSAESKAVFRTLLQLDPSYDLDLYRTSPKILEVFQQVAER